MTKIFTILSVGLCLLACESGPRETNLSSRVSGTSMSSNTYSSSDLSQVDINPSERFNTPEAKGEYEKQGQILERNLIKLKEYESCFRSGNDDCGTPSDFKEAYNASSNSLKKRIEIGLSHSELKEQTEKWVEEESVNHVPESIKDQVETGSVSLMFTGAGGDLGSSVLIAFIKAIEAIIMKVLDNFLGEVGSSLEGGEGLGELDG